MRKNIPFLAILLLSFSVLTAFNQPSKDVGYEISKNPTFKNLKVFPKNVSEEHLKAAMESFNEALGVKCSFCHAPGADNKLDFASDANPHKETARAMMKMTMGINKKYFKTKKPAEFAVNCATCHNGNEKPVELERGE